MPPAASAARTRSPPSSTATATSPIHVTLPGHDTMMALKHGGANALLELDIDGKTQLALTKQVQIDPIRRHLEHIDFVVVVKGEKVTVEVPVHLNGEAARETLVVTETATIQLEAEATHIPEYVEVDIEGARGRHPDPGLRPQAARRARTLLLDPETLIVNITEAPTAEEARGRARRGRGRGRHRARREPTRRRPRRPAPRATPRAPTRRPTRPEPRRTCP